MIRDTGFPLDADATSALLRPIALKQPAAIEFGPGAIGAIAAHVSAKGYRRPLVVASRFNAARIDLLRLSNPAVFGDARAEPDLANLEAALAMAEEIRPDVVVGFGGGSAMDFAKLVAALFASGQRFADVVGLNKLTGRRCGLIQAPTTSGTGSEVGARALVTDPKTMAKLAADSPFMLADLAVVDPDLTLSAPRDVTAATGVDAMAHCVEAFTNRKAHPIIDGYALAGIRLVGRYLARAVADGQTEARAGLALASMYGGFCLGPVNTAAGHAIAYPLGTRFHVAHGAANAAIFPHVLAFNAPVAREKTALVLDALGIAAASDILAAAYGYCQGLGIEMRLARLGVAETDIDAMASEAHAIRRLLDNNPRDLSRDDIAAIYRAAY